jgi:hypothetical protein
MEEITDLQSTTNANVENLKYEIDVAIEEIGNRYWENPGFIRLLEQHNEALVKNEDLVTMRRMIGKTYRNRSRKYI